VVGAGDDVVDRHRQPRLLAALADGRLFRRLARVDPAARQIGAAAAALEGDAILPSRSTMAKAAGRSG
jgi:hypothetical protein